MFVIYMTTTTQTEIEAAAFRQLIKHLQDHPEVQNIDLMNLADFCRNCLAKWYAAAATEQQVTIDYEQARTHIYGMPYQDWKNQYQKEATPEALARFNDKQP
jgi:uncharacterized protein